MTDNNNSSHANRSQTVVDNIDFNVSSLSSYFHLPPMSTSLLIIISSLIAFLLLLLVLVSIAIIMHRCCCFVRVSSKERITSGRKGKSSIVNATAPVKSNGNGAKRGLFGLMIARLDEFDSLTPLIVTPSSIVSCGNDDEQPIVAVASTATTHHHHSLSLTWSTPSSSSSNNNKCSASPPPPRRSTAGRTVIVPLTSLRGFKQTYCSGRSQRPIAVPVLGTPDSRVTTFETTLTTKSIGTIPEDTEESQSSSGCGLVLLPSPLSLLATSTDHHHRKENGYADSDLISIDRTSLSIFDRHVGGGSSANNYITANVSSSASRPHNFNGSSMPIVTPDFHVPPPSYSPPSPPPHCHHQSNQDRVLVAPKTLINDEHGSNVAAAAFCSSIIPVDNTSLRRFPSDPNHARIHKMDNVNNNNHANNNSDNRITIFNKISNVGGFESTTISSNLSTPSESSIGGDSPIDTTGSIAELSDSFYLASESDTTSDIRGRFYMTESGVQQRTNSAQSIELDLSTIDTTDMQRRYQLHRIEEEDSEQHQQIKDDIAPIECGGQLQLGSKNRMVDSKTFESSIGSILSSYGGGGSSGINSESNQLPLILLPRSISEQFEQIEREEQQQQLMRDRQQQ